MNTNLYARQWDVGSFTDPTKKPYKVSERHNGTWECSCPAWTRHMPRADCKHIRNVQAALRHTPAAPVFAPAASPTTRAPAITHDGYTIRRRPLDDTLAATVAADLGPTRTRREI
jgi:hypothetical protein